MTNTSRLSSFAVAWRDGRDTVHPGKLQLLPEGIRLETGARGGRLRILALRYAAISKVRTARGRDRLAGHPTLLLERPGRDPLAISCVGGAGNLAEVADQLSHRLGATA